MTFSTLLPANATQLERALESASPLADEADAIRTLYRPHEIPENLLPWLAWAFDVPIWPDDPVSRRNLVADSWRLHRLRGTLGGMKAIAAYVGAEIGRAVTPPAKMFLSPALTVSERNEFVSRHPQLRIYRYRRIGEQQGDALPEFFLGDAYPAITDAALRIAPRAFLWRNGVETELTVLERKETVASRKVETVTEVSEPGIAGDASFCGEALGWLLASEAGTRMYRLRLTGAYDERTTTLQRQTYPAGLSPIDAHYEAVGEAGEAPVDWLFAGACLDGFLVRSTAADRIYQRLHLFDPSIAAEQRGSSTFLGDARLGMPAHNAELLLSVPGEANQLAFGNFVFGYLVTPDRKPLDDALDALSWMARASDRICIDTAIRQPLRGGAAFVAGAHVAGEWINR